METEELGPRLRRLRLEAGLSQTALAGDDLSPSYVSLIESGRRRPTHEVASKLAERLGVSVTMVLEGREPASTQAATLSLNLARLALADGNVREAEAKFRELLADESLPQSIRDDAQMGLARALENEGDLPAAIGTLSPLYERAVDGRTGIPITTLGIRLCRVYLDAGDLHRAVDIGEQALALASERGLEGTDDQLRLAATVMAAYFDRGDLNHATAFADKWLPVAEQVGSRTGQGSIYWNAAIVAEARGDIDQAARYSTRALAHLSEGDDTRDLSRLRVACAWLWLRLNPPEVDRAVAELDKAREDLERWSGPVDVAYWFTARSQAALLQGRADEAVQFAEEALTRLGSHRGIEACQARIILGDALVAGGQRERAVREFRSAADLLKELPAGRASAECWRAIGERLQSESDAAAEAVDAYRRALDDAGIRPSVASLDRVVDVMA
jgi:tetratricopeptide (TPR) repeat protein